MKIVLIIGNARSGLSFLQSLFDGHSQISQLPSNLDYKQFWPIASGLNDSKSIGKKFIEKYNFIFDSRLSTIDRHDKLGENQNDFYEVNSNVFLENFINYMEKKEINIENTLTSLHLAYSKAAKQDVTKIDTIIIKIKSTDQIFFLKEMKPDIIYLIRSPIVALSSSFSGWLNYKKSLMTPYNLFFNINREISGINYLAEQKIKINVLKIEDLRNEKTLMINKICKLLSLKFEKLLENSTYHSKMWWGDKFSVNRKKTLDHGFNYDFKNYLYSNLFYKKDIQSLERMMFFYITKYKYSFITNQSDLKLKEFLPYKIELIVFKNMLFSLRFTECFKCIYYWIKRINLVTSKKYINIDLPRPF